MDLIKGLNVQQQQAVMAGLGPVLVLAGPGSGKTRVLTHRIAYLISQMGVRPHRILAVTFTNKAAREMEKRVVDLLGEQVRGITLGTFHAVCARILRREAERLPVDANFVIFDADDQLTLVKQAIKDLNLDDKRYRPQSMHAAISHAKNELKTADDFVVNTYRDEVCKRIYTYYQGLLLASNAVDFDDLLLYTARLLEEYPDLRQKYARRFEHVLVDEFQDTNVAQYLLLKHLASFHRNIFVVGDTDQSIYRWRGADYRNVLRFEDDYPDAQRILLEQNYRSTQNILDAAMAVIDRHPNRAHKHLFTSRGSGSQVIIHQTYNDYEEAAFVVNTIENMVMRKQASLGDFAVMYRMNAQSRVLEEAFLRAALPYRIVGAQRFYGRREIKDLIAYLRLVHNPKDEISLLRVINVPPRKIGAKTVEALYVQAKQFGLSAGELLLELGRNPGDFQEVLGGRMVALLAGVGRMLSDWQTLASMREVPGDEPEQADENATQGIPPLVILDRILQDTGYRDYIDDGTEEGQSRWENVMELRRIAAEQRRGGLAGFLEKLALVADQDTLDEGSNANIINAPTLLTLHAAKGLEFPVVFIVGLNEGTLPHYRAIHDGDEEEMLEERRLFYVGITRAKDHLYLLFTEQRSHFGYAEEAEPSRFLDDIAPQLMKGMTLPHPKRRASVSEQAPSRGGRWESLPVGSAEVKRSADGVNQRPTPAPQANIERKYQVGMRVRHFEWGEGLVLNCVYQDDDEILDVFFEDVGLKRVMASIARLQIRR